jgi:hypothetical protein
MVLSRPGLHWQRVLLPSRLLLVMTLPVRWHLLCRLLTFLVSYPDTGLMDGVVGLTTMAPTPLNSAYINQLPIGHALPLDLTCGQELTIKLGLGLDRIA